ncbi:MAG: hypothetical protein RIQ93_794 [Verrucomicrobiota bacterium]
MLLITIVSLILNIAGTVIVSVSANGLFSALHVTLKAHDTTLQLYLGGHKVLVFTGLDQMRERQMSRSKKWLIYGLILISIAFALQVCVSFATLKM